MINRNSIAPNLRLLFFVAIISGMLYPVTAQPDDQFKIFQFPADRIPRIDGDPKDWIIVPEDYSIGTEYLSDDERIHTNDLSRACALAWFMKKDFFWSIGGMNEKYDGYGNEDCDTYIRAKHILKEIPEMEYEIVHHYHHWHQADSCYALNKNRHELLEETKKDTLKEINRLCQVNTKKISS